MIVTIINIQDNTKYAKFTWSDDFADCDHISFNIEDFEFDLMLRSKAFEGASLDGWIVDIELT